MLTRAISFFKILRFFFPFSAVLISSFISIYAEQKQILTWSEFGTCVSLFTQEGKKSIKFNNPPLSGTGVYQFSDSEFVSWPLENNKGSIQIKGCTLVRPFNQPEKNALYCSPGAILKTSDSFVLCGFEFNGEIAITENGIEILQGTFKAIDSGLK